MRYDVKDIVALRSEKAVIVHGLVELKRQVVRRRCGEVFRVQVIRRRAITTVYYRHVHEVGGGV